MVRTIKALILGESRMLVAVLGCLIFVVSVLQIRFPGLAVMLKNTEPEIWKSLGAPSGFSFTDLGNTISLYTWILSKRFLDSDNPELVEAAKRAHAKARRVQCGLILGLIMMVAGFAVALLRTFA